MVGGGGDNKIASLLDRGNMALEDGDWAKADSFFEDVLNNDSKNAQAYLGKTLAQEKCRTIDAFARKRKDAAATAKSETLTLEPNYSHINEMAQKFSLPGYVSQKQILKLYDFDLSYRSSVADRKRQYSDEGRYWQTHKQLSRAEQFAAGAVAENLKKEKDALFVVLSERVKKAEADEAAAAADLKNRYAAHLAKADEKAEELYNKGLESREQHYESLLRIAKVSADVAELKDTAAKFEALGDFKDSKNLAEHCHKRAAEEQAKVDAENTRQRILAEEEAARQRILAEKEARARAAKKKIIGILAGLLVVAVIAAVVVVTQVIIPGNKYTAAEELLNAGRYEEAISAFEAMGNYKDSPERLVEAKLGYSKVLWDSGEQYDALDILEELTESGNTESAELARELQYDYAVDLQEKGSYWFAALDFEDLGDYQDSFARWQECIYLYAAEKLKDTYYDEAVELYQSLGDYKDSATWAIYSQARELAEDNLFDAEELLRQLPEDYPDVSVMLDGIERYRHWDCEFECTEFYGNHQIYYYAMPIIVYDQFFTDDTPGFKFYLHLSRESGELGALRYPLPSDNEVNADGFEYMSGTPDSEYGWEEITVGKNSIKVVDYEIWEYSDTPLTTTYVFSSTK